MTFSRALALVLSIAAAILAAALLASRFVTGMALSDDPFLAAVLAAGGGTCGRVVVACRSILQPASRPAHRHRVTSVVDRVMRPPSLSGEG